VDRIRLRLAGAGQLELDDIVPRFNIAPGQSVLAILDLEQQTFAKMLLWGLVPSWSKEPKGFINARAETLAEKPSFSESFQRRRCLMNGSERAGPGRRSSFR
jgi:putative SOS response-associated peptidase YedK